MELEDQDAHKCAVEFGLYNENRPANWTTREVDEVPNSVK